MKSEKSILGLIFIMFLFLLCFNYSLEGYYQDTSVYDLLNGYSEDQIMIYGPVIDTNNNGFLVYNINNQKVYTVKTNIKLNLGTGTYILGVLDSNNQIIINKIMTFKMSSVLDIILRSLFGFILFLIIFVKYWKFNPKKLLFMRRK